jgi:hypothetical protein
VVECGKALIANGSIKNLMCLSTTDSNLKGSIQNLKQLSTKDSVSKRCYSEPDAVEYNKDSRLQHDLIHSWY